MIKQKIVVSVTNDLVVDQRADKICQTLLELNFDVILVGRLLPNSAPISRSYQTKRFKLLFNNGPLFYACYNIRLFFFLLFSSHQILWSNDLDSLPANYLISKLKDSKLIYDSHEYFTEVPELVNRPRKQKVWKKIEAAILPKLKNAVTVCESIAKAYKKQYQTEFKVARNLPLIKNTFTEVKQLKEANKHIIIYQGAINVNRGLEELVEAMLDVNNAILYIIGDGDISSEISDSIRNLNLSDKVKMLGKIPFHILHNYTKQADLGVSLEKDTNLNYKYALPNKLFDYIQAQVPVLVSNLPEMGKIITDYQVGETIENINPKEIAKRINDLLANEKDLKAYKNNTLKASIDLCWEKEKQVIYDLIKEIK